MVLEKSWLGFTFSRFLGYVCVDEQNFVEVTGYTLCIGEIISHPTRIELKSFNNKNDAYCLLALARVKIASIKEILSQKRFR